MDEVAPETTETFKMKRLFVLKDAGACNGAVNFAR